MLSVVSGRIVRTAFAGSLLAILAACTAAPESSERRVSSISKEGNGRWTPPGSDATGTPDGLEGEQCSGGIKPGAKMLGDQIKEQFNTTYGGYACRANTANKKELSIHAVGRALDIMASGAAGDEIANYLVTNASDLGVQRIIWNRTIWQISPSGPTSKAYSGPNPHTDHVHAEVTIATATHGPGDVSQDPSGGVDADGNPIEPGMGDPSSPFPTDPYTGDPYDDDYSGDFGDDWYPDDELECESAVDCDASGAIMCVQGYCDYWGPGW